MQRNVRSLLVGLILFITTIIACQPGQLNLENYMKQGDKVLIAINDTIPVLTNRQLFEHLWASEDWHNGGTIDTATLAQVVDSILMDTVVGLMADIDVEPADNFLQYWTCKTGYDEILLGAYYKKYVYSQIDIDSSMVLEFRDKHVEKYSIPGQVFFHHILVSPKYYEFGPNALDYKDKSSEELAAIQADFATELYEAIVNGESFEAIAMEYSHDKMTQREGGLVGWSIRNRYHEPFDSIAFSAELNVVQPPYLDVDGWHIIKVTDKVEDGPVPLDRPEFFAGVYGDLRSELSKSFVAEIMDSLKQDITIEYNEEVLDLDVFRSEADIVSAVINGIDTIYFMNLRNLELDYRQAYGLRNSTPEVKKEMIRRLANPSRVVMAAIDEKMDTIPEIRQLRYDIYHETARTLVLGSRFDPTWRATESEIANYYEVNKQDYVIDQPLKIQTMLVPDSILADFLSDQANSGIDLAELEREYVGKVSGQDVSVKPIGPNDISERMWTLFHKIPVGSTTQPIKQDSLWAITKLIERKMSITLDYAHGDIVSILTKKHIADEIARFTRENSVRFGVSRINSLTPIHLKPLRYRYDMVL